MPISAKPRSMRPECRYEPRNGRFLVDCDFSKQYHHYYRKRLETTRPKLVAACRQKWDPKLPICSLADLANTKHTTCICIGTIFKRMKQQPDVIEELSGGAFEISSDNYRGCYSTKDDTLTLEDNEESILLIGKIDPESLVTGVTVALLGNPMNDRGKFSVIDICYVEPGRELSIRQGQLRDSTQSKSTFLMVVSSFGFQHNMGESSKLTKALQDMIDFIFGNEKYSNDPRSSRVARVLVVGDNLRVEGSESLDEESLETEQGGNKKSASQQVRTYAESTRAAQHMDDFFAQLSKTIHVDVMPGASDPSSHLMPQQPFHPCIFPRSSMFPTFNCTTNPHYAIYDDVEVLATGGQNVGIIGKFSGIRDPIEIMKCHLRWGNSAPSAPDNLFSAPFEKEDPFVLDTIPDIYIAGCQESYAVDNYVRQIEGEAPVKTLLVSVPRFNKTRSCVLVDLENLDSQLISFN